jgi:hypothetical protein
VKVSTHSPYFSIHELNFTLLVTVAPVVQERGEALDEVFDHVRALEAGANDSQQVSSHFRIFFIPSFTLLDTLRQMRNKLSTAFLRM